MLIATDPISGTQLHAAAYDEAQLSTWLSELYEQNGEVRVELSEGTRAAQRAAKVRAAIHAQTDAESLLGVVADSSAAGLVILATFLAAIQQAKDLADLQARIAPLSDIAQSFLAPLMAGAVVFPYQVKAAQKQAQPSPVEPLNPVALGAIFEDVVKASAIVSGAMATPPS